MAWMSSCSSCSAATILNHHHTFSLHSKQPTIFTRPHVKNLTKKPHKNSLVTIRRIKAKSTDTNTEEFDCLGTGLDVERVVPTNNPNEKLSKTTNASADENGEFLLLQKPLVRAIWEWGLLISPFFFWGTAMVAMKEVLPKTGVFFVSAFRLIPAGLLLVAFAAFKGRKFPSGFTAWLSIALFALVDATCFQGFLAEGLERTSAGLGSIAKR